MVLRTVHTALALLTALIERSHMSVCSEPPLVAAAGRLNVITYLSGYTGDL